MTEHDVNQGSPEWYKLRRGIPTGSEFSRIINATKGPIEVPKDQAQSVLASREFSGMKLSDANLAELQADYDPKSRKKYCRFSDYRLAAGRESYIAELIAASCGWIPSFQGSPDTERGNLLERFAADWYQFRHGEQLREVGFLTSSCGKYGASPDRMTQDGRPVEIKCPSLHTFIKWRMDCDDNGEPKLPLDHKAQIHGEMICAEADSAVFIAYADSEYIDNFTITVQRDDFTDRLAEHLETFCAELDEWRRRLTGDEYEILFGE